MQHYLPRHGPCCTIRLPLRWFLPFWCVGQPAVIPAYVGKLRHAWTWTTCHIP
jgi:hypothetical protein